jgi:hypothetical protein
VDSDRRKFEFSSDHAHTPRAGEIPNIAEFYFSIGFLFQEALRFIIQLSRLAEVNRHE